jgi:hypothetical protein
VAPVGFVPLAKVTLPPLRAVAPVRDADEPLVILVVGLQVMTFGIAEMTKLAVVADD